MKWISVEDRLPSEMLDILLIHAPARGGPSSIFMGYRSDDYWFETHYYCPKNVPHKIPATDITHWMPLPEPPEDGEKFRTVKPAPTEPTNFTRAECMAAIIKVDAADEITKRRQAKPDYELDTYITGVRIGNTGKTQWHIRLDEGVDTLQAAAIFEKVAEVLQTNSEPPESDNG